MVKVLNFKVVIEQDKDGFFIASVPTIPGCHTQGDTYEEAMDNTKEVIELSLEVAEDNPEYKAKIDFEEESDKSRFLGITELPVRFQFSQIDA